MTADEKACARAGLFTYDQALRQTQGEALCGVDEAGRGPLAGPVFAAAVVLPAGCRAEDLAFLDDSKKVTPRRREILFDQIRALACSYSLAAASVEEIERYNILGASLLAMQRAVSGLDGGACLVLVDGNRLPELEVPARALVGGDRVSASVAAASILAKVARDRYMCDLAEKYPAYGFEKHKGYGTALHYQALRQYGPTPAHRTSFLGGGGRWSEER